MLLSLAVLLIPILLIVWFFQQTPDEPPLEQVNWKSTVATARQEADFPVLAPTELPANWRATSATWATKGTAQGGRTLAGDEFALGLLTAQNQHLSLKQSDAPATPWLADVMRDGYEVGMVDIAAIRWTTWESGDGRTHYLSSTVDGSSVVIGGDVDQQVLVDYAGMLSQG